MPHLRIRAMTENHVKALSQELPKELSLIIKTPEENFTVEKVQTTFYRNGSIVSDEKNDPMVEVHWFNRGAEIKQQVAQKVTELVRMKVQSEYIVVLFVDLQKADYFENGVHF